MDWGRLGKAVVERRVELGFQTREGFAVPAGISSRLLSDIENGKRNSYGKSTLPRLEQALGWAPGSIDALLAGGTATVAEPGPTLPIARTQSARRPPGLWLADLDVPALPDLPPYVQHALTAHAMAMQDRLERDLTLITARLRAASEDGFQPANAVEARMLVHALAPSTAQDKPWKLTVALAELDHLYLAAPAGSRPQLSTYPWEQMSDPAIKPLLSVAVFTSPERVVDYDSSLTPLPATPQEIVNAWPEDVAVLDVNPSSPIGYRSSPSSLHDAVRLIAGEVQLDPSAND